MKRPMCILAVSWLAGLLLAGRETAMETKLILILYFILIILGLLFLKKNPELLKPYIQSEWYPQLTLLLLAVPCFFLGGIWRMEQAVILREQQELPWKILAQEGEVYVTVEGTVKEKRLENRVILELTDCLLVGCYDRENQSAGDCRVTVDGEGKEWLPEVFTGNRIRVFGKFSTFQPASNPGQFNAYEYYSAKGLSADVSALKVTILNEETDTVGHVMFMLKQKMRESISSLYPEEKAGVLTAMILGDKDLLLEEVEELYRQNGISHILAISGLHISMLCMGMFEILRKLTVPLKASAAVTVCFLTFYILFTGASTSSLRAGVMCLVVIGAKLLRRSYDLLSSLSLAAVAVTFLRPFELTSAGFLLSFGAVLGVALAQEAEQKLKQEKEGKLPWWNALVFGGMIQCVTIPISLWFFYELSPYSILLNLIVIPLVSLILGGGIFSASFGLFLPMLAKFPVGGTCLLLEFYEWLCRITQKLPFSFVLAGRPEVWQMVVYYGVLAAGLKLFFGKEKKASQKKRGWCAASLLCAFFLLTLPGRGTAEILFLDVSQGDGALIFTEKGKVILSDCGSSDVSGVGEYRLSPVLKQKGTLLVDVAVVSHLDTDHVSGIRELLESMPVYRGQTHYAADYQGTVGIAELVLPKVTEKSESYLELERLAVQKNVTVRYMQAGEMLYCEEELLIECIYPETARKSENDTSLVFLMQTPQAVVWLMGDAGTAAETEILERLAAVDMENLRAGRIVLLKAGHHGSKTSSGQNFLDFIRPEVAVVSCGYQNSYGHPHKEVVERFLAGGIQIFRTDLQGAVAVELKRHGKPEIYGWRNKNLGSR